MSPVLVAYASSLIETVKGDDCSVRSWNQLAIDPWHPVGSFHYSRIVLSLLRFNMLQSWGLKWTMKWFLRSG